MTDKDKDTEKAATEGDRDLDIKDLLLDQAFLTEWERSLIAGSREEPGESSAQESDQAEEPHKPEPEADDDLDIADLVLDGSILSELEESFAAAPGEGDAAPEDPEPEPDDYLDLKDLVLDGDFLGQWERSLAEGREIESAQQAAPAELAETPSLDEPDLDEPGRDERDPGEPPMDEGAAPQGPGEDAAPDASRIPLPFMGKVSLPSRWLYVGLLAVGLVALLAMGIPLFTAKPPKHEDPAQAMISAREQVVVKGLYLPVEKGERGLYLSINLLLGEGEGSAYGKDDTVWLTEAAYDAVHSFKIHQLKGYVGMKALKHRILEIAKAKRPGLKVKGIEFSDYLIL